MSRNTIWSFCMSFAVALLIAVAPAPSAAQGDFSAADKAAMKAYVLDTGKVNRYIAALTALAMAKTSDNTIAAEYERMESEPAESIAEMRASLARHPRVFAFFQRQNLTADDTILIPFVLLSAGVAAAVPGQMADTVSPAQVNFVRTNAALMGRLSAANDALEGSQ